MLSGLVDKHILTDLNYVEMSSGAPHFCVGVLTRSNKVVLSKVRSFNRCLLVLVCSRGDSSYPHNDD